MGHEQVTRSELEALEGAYLVTEACAAAELDDDDRAVAISWAQSEISRRVKRYMRDRAERPRPCAQPEGSDDVVLAAMRLNAAWLSGDVAGLRERGRELRARMTEFEEADFAKAAAARAGAVLRLTEVACQTPASTVSRASSARGEEAPDVGSEGDITVVRDDERERFEVLVDGIPAGVCEYRLSPESIVFIHTEISPAFEGRGLGSHLVSAALSFAREASLVVLPLCPFVADYIARHPEYQDLTPD